MRQSKYLAAALILFLVLGGIFAGRFILHRSRVRAINDIIYTKASGQDLHLDLLIPRGLSSTRHPAVIWLHGGGWRAGTYKENGAAWLADHGYVVASVEYRLSPRFAYPAQIHDCKAAVRFLRRNAGSYGIDPNRIGVLGASAGGHLGALLGTTNGISLLEGIEGPQRISSRVQAVVDYFGPADLTKWKDAAGRDVSPVVMLLNGTSSQKPWLARLASPVNFPSANGSPTLIVHGEKDHDVPIRQSEELYEAMQRTGMDVTFIRVKNADHGFVGMDIEPSLEEIDDSVLRFFDEHLKS